MAIHLNHIIEGDRRYRDDEDFGRHGYSQQEFSDGELVDVDEEPEDTDDSILDDFMEFNDDDMDLE